MTSKTPKEFYELCAKWVVLPDFGTRFKFKGAEYEVVGVVPAGNKIRARGPEDKIFLFEARDFWKKYRAVKI